MDKLKDEYKHMNDEVLNIAITLQKSTKLSTSVSNLILLLIEARDKTDYLIKTHVRSIDSFGWYSLPRTFMTR